MNIECIEKKNRIAEALKIRKMKQVELCEIIGVNKSSVNSWIKQRWQPKPKALFAMAKALDVSELWLAGYDVPMEQSTEQTTEKSIEQIKIDELAVLINQFINNDEFKNLCLDIASLNADQFFVIKRMVSELVKATR